MGRVQNLNKSLAFAKCQINDCSFLAAYKTAAGEEKIKAVVKVNGKKEDIFIPKEGSIPGGYKEFTVADVVELISVINEYKSNKESLQ